MSPFNVKVDSLSLENFSQADVTTLDAQHTTETGQVFEPKAVELAHELPQGQPWLVNAIARQLTEEIVPDPNHAITPDHVQTAKEVLIQRRDTHLDSLAERLRDDRVRAIIEPILAGQELGNIPQDDIQFALDLGLCVMDKQGSLAIANPIYREVLPRVLAFTPMASLPQISPTWRNEDGTLDTNDLLQAFLAS